MNINFKISVFLAIIFQYIRAQTPEDDLVTNLPGYENVGVNVYSGYLNVTPTGSRKLHYVLFESQNKPIDDNLLIWFNGGPGCSSMGGSIKENGPRLINGIDDFLSENEYSWNKEANVLYLEGPPGTGYSVNYEADYQYTDENTAKDFFAGFQEFLALFKNTLNLDNPIWISGESYAGVYIPFFVKEIVDFNKQASALEKINIKGFMIGNGVWNTDDSVKSLYRQNEYVKNFFFTNQDKQIFYDHCVFDQQSESCKEFNKVYDNVKNNTYSYQIYNYTYSYQPFDEPDRVPTPDDREDQYYNLQSVRDAFHIDNNIRFTNCNDTIGDTYQRAQNSTYLYPEFLDLGLEILTFSGNTDGVIPTDYTWYSINQLFDDYKPDLTITDKWRQWKNLPNKQVGGMTQTWSTPSGSRFSLAMVRASGHMVPENQPISAYYMVKRFMNGEDI